MTPIRNRLQTSPIQIPLCLLVVLCVAPQWARAEEAGATAAKSPSHKLPVFRAT